MGSIIESTVTIDDWIIMRPTQILHVLVDETLNLILNPQSQRKKLKDSGLCLCK